MARTGTKNGTVVMGWLKLGVTVIVLVVAVAVAYATVAAQVRQNSKDIEDCEHLQKDSFTLLLGIDKRTCVIEQMITDLKARDARTAAATKEMNQ